MHACSFLATSATGHRGSSRKPINFHAHFKSLHAAEAADSARRTREARAQTKADLAPASTYVAPTSKRRDALRWDVRMRFKDVDAE